MIGEGIYEHNDQHTYHTSWKPSHKGNSLIHGHGLRTELESATWRRLAYRSDVDSRSPGPAGCQLSYGDAEDLESGGPWDGGEAEGYATAEPSSTSNENVSCMMNV